MNKKILTIDDLYKFCEKQNFSEFSSKDKGYSLRVQVPAVFEVIESEDASRRGLMKLKFKVFHEGRNRKNTYVSKESAEEAMPSLKNRPILAHIHQLDNGEWDFERHNLEVSKDEDGNEIIEYIEKQVGSLSEDDPFWEYDEEVDKDFVCTYGYIPEEYTKAADIIRRKGGTKNSCELSIDEFSYDAKEKYLVLKKFYLTGTTLLGSKKDGTPIGEGMLGSRADIADFSAENNSVTFDNTNNTILDEINRKLNTLVNFAENNSKEGGKAVTKLEELLAKYEKSIEDLTFEYENLSDEELEKAFSDAFEETQTDDENADNTNSDDDNNESTEDSEGEDNTDDTDDVTKNALTYTVSMNGKTQNFELSLDEVQNAIYQLVNDTYAEVDNAYYGVIVYDEYVVMYQWGGNAYKQTYTRNGDEFTLTGDRIEVFTKYLTQDEIDTLDNLKSKYDEVSEKLSKYEDAEIKAQKDAILADEAYSKYLETDEFKELSDNKDDYSVDELRDKAEMAFSKVVKRMGYSLENDETEAKPKNKISSVMFGSNKTSKKNSKYGSLKFN